MDHWFTLSAGMMTRTGPGGLTLVGVALFLGLAAMAVLMLNAQHLPPWLRPPVPPGLRARITVAMVLMATVPAISLALVLTDRASRQRAERVAASLQAEAAGLAGHLAAVVDATAAEIATLASHVGREPAITPAVLERQLRLHHQWSSSIVGLVAVSAGNEAVAATAIVGGSVAPISLAGMPVHLPAGIAYRFGGDEVTVSGARRDPVLGERTTLLVTAVISGGGGARWGTVTGAVDLAATDAARAWLQDGQPRELVVSDANGHVLFASRGSGLRPLDSLPPGWVTGPQETGKPAPGGAVTPAKAAAPDHIRASATFGPGLQVLLLAPPSALGMARAQELAVALGWLIGALVVAGGLAVALSGSIAGPLDALDAAVRGFDPDLRHGVPVPPPGAPREVAVVFAHLAGAAQSQRRAYDDLQRSLAEGERLRRELVSVLEGREAEIRERTQQLKLANEQLDRLSRTDALTGVANRRGLAEFLDRAWRASQREQVPVSLLLVDIDHFKAYNDRHGHPQGDRCLQAVANAIRHVAGRATDMVARYGGEEFAVVLGNTPLEGALLVAEQVRSAIEGLGIAHGTPPGAAVVTVSVGVTSVLPVRGSQPDACLEAADRALYAAKAQGRNRVGYSMMSRTAMYQPASAPGNPDRRLS
ncbi:MAG: GGDEF domain-containing protein [Gammaproteobacteria bacterium]|nr:GGDEF domain-containing protein [Gammaproteobacteria bacterium]